MRLNDADRPLQPGDEVAAHVLALRAALQRRPTPVTPLTDGEPLTRQPVPQLPS